MHVIRERNEPTAHSAAEIHVVTSAEPSSTVNGPRFLATSSRQSRSGCSRFRFALGAHRRHVVVALRPPRESTMFDT